MGHESDTAPCVADGVCDGVKFAGSGLKSQMARLVPAVRGAALGAACVVLGGAGAAAQTTGVTTPTSQPTGAAGAQSTPANNAVPQAAGSTASSATPEQNLEAAKPEPTVAPLSANLNQYAGLKVTAIQYAGVEFTQSDRLTQELSQKAGEPFEPEKVRQTTRRLFATGRYRDIDVRVQRTGDGVTLIFAGTARYYVGRVQIEGVRDDRLASLLEYGTNLNPGTAFADTDVPVATDSVKQVLAQNGYYEPKIAVTTGRDDCRAAGERHLHDCCGSAGACGNGDA